MKKGHGIQASGRGSRWCHLADGNYRAGVSFLTEQQHVAGLVAALHQIDPLLPRLIDVVPAPVAGSALRQDNKLTHPHTTSHFAWHALSAGLEHLSHLKDWVDEAVAPRSNRGLMRYPPYTVLRAAIENTASVVWLLSPPDVETRVMRRLWRAVDDIKNESRVLALMGITGNRSFDDKIADVKKLADAAGVTLPNIRPDWVGVIETAERATGAQDVVTTWRLCSAVMHGDNWAWIMMSDRQETRPPTDGVAHVKVDISIPRLHWTAMKAVGMAVHAWRLYHERAGYPERV